MANISKQIIGLIIIPVLFAATSVSASEITGELSNQGLVPTASSNVSASKTGDNQITVIWSAVAGVDGYKVYRIKNGGSAELAANYGSAILTHIDSSLSDGNYSYQVQPFLGTLSPNLNNILPTLPISIVAPTFPPTGGGGGGGGGGGITSSPTPTSPLSVAAQKVDANKDNKIDVLDFNILMVNWGSTSVNNTVDFNGDSKVDIFDFNSLMINWIS